MNSYKFKRLRGVDDLQNTYAFVGNSQGDSFCSNDVKEGLSQGDWASFTFEGIDKTDQEAIYKESLRRQRENEVYIFKLKEEGRFEEPYDLVIHFKPYSLFDNL
jgi:hypothetical protein